MSIFRRNRQARKEPKMWITPDGEYSVLSGKVLEAEHTLIAGSTGCGKSTFLHSIMQALLVQYAPSQAQMILCDPKRVELKRYEHLPHTISYATEYDTILSALNHALGIMEARYTWMEQRGQEDWVDGSHIYVIIEELADLMVCPLKTHIKVAIQKLTQKGRAAGISVIALSQSPSRKTIPAEVTLNFTCKIALACDTAIESKQIVGIAGAEDLPDHGVCIYKYRRQVNWYKLPFVQKADILPLINYWMSDACMA